MVGMQRARVPVDVSASAVAPARARTELVALPAPRSGGSPSRGSCARPPPAAGRPEEVRREGSRGPGSGREGSVCERPMRLGTAGGRAQEPCTAAASCLTAQNSPGGAPAPASTCRGRQPTAGGATWHSSLGSAAAPSQSAPALPPPRPPRPRRRPPAPAAVGRIGGERREHGDAPAASTARPGEGQQPPPSAACARPEGSRASLTHRLQRLAPVVPARVDLLVERRNVCKTA